MVEVAVVVVVLLVVVMERTARNDAVLPVSFSAAVLGRFRSQAPSPPAFLSSQTASFLCISLKGY